MWEKHYKNIHIQETSELLPKNEQIENKKTTINNKIMQTQQRGKWTRYKWIVGQKCLQKQQKLETQTRNRKWTGRKQ